jgi:hypothetical protein
MNSVLRTAFFTSAFAPALLISVGAQIYDTGFAAQHWLWLLAGLLGCVFPFLVVAAVSEKNELLPFEAKKIESQDWLLIVFVVSYFLPIVNKVNDQGVFVLVLVGAAVLLACVEAIPCHPLLHALKYRFYKVEGANGMIYTMISRRKILSASDVRFIRQISTNMLMEGSV